MLISHAVFATIFGWLFSDIMTSACEYVQARRLDRIINKNHFFFSADNVVTLQ